MNTPEVFDISQLPSTSNLALVGPYRVTLEEFHAMPVSPQVLRARAMIYQLEEMLNNANDPALVAACQLEPIHRIGKGEYQRELTMPAGTIIVGHRHAQEHLVTMLNGFLTVVTERGWEDLHGYNTFISPAGEKRVLIIHEDTTWITTHETNETTLELIEKDLILDEQLLIQHKYTKRISGG